jgi:hypothetical protein
MHLRELIVEGAPGCPDPTRLELGQGHVVIHGGDRLVSWLRQLLSSGEGEPGGGRLCWVVEGPAGEERLVIEPGGQRPTSPWLPDPRGAEALLFQVGPLAQAGPSRSREELIQTLANLDRELEVATEVERLEAELERLDRELSSLDQRLQKLQQVEVEAQEAARQFASFPAISESLAGAVDAYEAAQRKMEAREARLDEALGSLQAPAVATSLRDLLQDRRLGWGIAGGIVLLGAAAFGPWRELALLSIPAFGVAAWVSLTSIAAAQEVERVGKRRRVLEGQLRKLQEGWAKEGREVREALASLGLESVGALRAWLKQRQEAADRATAAAAAWAEAQEDPELLSASSIRRRIAQRRGETEDALVAKVAGIFRSRDEVEHHRRDVRRLLEEAAAPVADPSVPWIDGLCHLLGDGREAVLARVGPNASRLLSALTDGAWIAVGWGPAGGVACKGTAGVVRFDALPSQERELVRASLALAAAMEGREKGLALLVLDRPFDRLPSQEQGALARALRWAADQGVQVLHRSEAPPFSTTAHEVLEAP